MKRCKLKVTVVKTFEAEFEDVLAASEMIKTLERHENPAVLNGMATGRWKIVAKEQCQSVEVLDDDRILGGVS